MADFKLSDLMGPGFAANNAAPLFDSIVRDNDVPNVFGLQCCWSFGGRMTLGGTDLALCSGELAYTPIACSTALCVDITRIGTSISGMMPVAFQGFPGDNFSPGTSVDSGNPYLTLPIDAYMNVSAVINQRAASAGIGNASVPAFGLPYMCRTFEPCACVTQANLTHFPEIWLELLGGAVAQNASLLVLPATGGERVFGVIRVCQRFWRRPRPSHIRDILHRLRQRPQPNRFCATRRLLRVEFGHARSPRDFYVKLAGFI